jgi:hypothetical protein
MAVISPHFCQKATCSALDLPYILIIIKRDDNGDEKPDYGDINYTISVIFSFISVISAT